ncbi:MAG TPA: tyrosine-type recombinase/integrase [Caulobacteraceae bacterium]|nr:tyrosine-type recombinase/integrase [Caulobacteraceae bacterium]
MRELFEAPREAVFVAMYDELSEALALASKRGICVLTMPGGQPWKADYFRHSFKEACRAADIPDELHFHDLRGSALKAFADAGASELELRAISGHSMSQMGGALGHYINPFRSLAESAVQSGQNARRTKSANRKCKPTTKGTA